MIIHENGQAKTIEIAAQNVVINFENSMPGYYYCELHIDDKVYREQILKLDE